jgi:hypothetical protein
MNVHLDLFLYFDTGPLDTFDEDGHYRDDVKDARGNYHDFEMLHDQTFFPDDDVEEQQKELFQ